MCKTPCCDSSSGGSLMTPIAVVGGILLLAAAAGPAVAAAEAFIHLVIVTLIVLACVAGAAGLACVGVALARRQRHLTYARTRLRGQVVYGLPQGRVADTPVEGSGSNQLPAPVLAAIEAPSWPDNPHLGLSSSAAGTGRHTLDSQVRDALDAGRQGDAVMALLGRAGMDATPWQEAMLRAAFDDPTRPLRPGIAGRRS